MDLGNRPGFFLVPSSAVKAQSHGSLASCKLATSGPGTPLAVWGTIFAMGVIDVSVLNLSGRYFHFQAGCTQELPPGNLT